MKPHLTMWNYYRRQRSCGKVMFSQACVILFTGGVSASVYAGIPHTPTGADTPPDQTPPWEQTPLEQTHTQPPPGADLPGADTPQSRHPLGVDTPQSRHPPGTDTPQELTPPWSRHPPSRHHAGSRHPPRRHPPGVDTPLAQSMLGDTVNARAVRILLECNFVPQWSYKSLLDMGVESVFFSPINLLGPIHTKRKREQK